MAAKAASRITDADVERLRKLTQRDVEMGTPFNPANTGFHLLLIDLAGNQRARDTVAGLLYQLERVANLRLTVAAEGSLIREHEQIIDAMARDPRRAGAVADHRGRAPHRHQRHPESRHFGRDRPSLTQRPRRRSVPHTCSPVELLPRSRVR
jgi:DNA-binding FadR family transcriptional regulator